MTKKIELEEDLKLTDIGKAFIDDVESVKDYLPKCNSMEFPQTFDEFAKDYGFTDDKEIYTNGSHLIPVFRVKQWLDHIEQQSSEDVMAIQTQGLDEGIRCAMCTNTMKSDRGCDGGCVVDEDMYKKVMDTIKNQMFNQPTSEDCVSKQAVVEYIKACGAELGHDCENELVVEDIQALPPVTPTHGTCKDCKYWKDSDGVYRRGVGAESKCPINIKEVYEGNFYCKWFEKRGSENEVD